MAVISFIVDHRPPYMQDQERAFSLLDLPLGVGSLLEHHFQEIMIAEPEETYIFPTFEIDETYQRRIFEATSGNGKVVPLAEQKSLLENLEGGDIIYVRDSRYWVEDVPTVSELIEACQTDRTVANVISTVKGMAPNHERIIFDDDGQIKRVRRLYDKISLSKNTHLKVIASAMPQQLAETATIFPLDQARLEIISHGIPSRDHMTQKRLFDLFDSGDVLELNRRILADQIKVADPPQGYVYRGPNVLVAKTASVHQSARTVGPVIVKDGATIAANTTVIGPCVIGYRAQVDIDSVVARSILLDDHVVERGRQVIDAIGKVGSNGNGSDHAAYAGTLLMPDTWDETRSTHESDAGQPVGSGKPCLSPARAHKRLYMGSKRIFDMVVSLVGLLFLLPFFPIIALLLKLDSRGPIFFVHRREGVGGREFPCLKFRTMVSDAHRMQRRLYSQNEVDGPQFNLANDTRITRLGNILRKFNIDELPQLINVLVGHMSLVGPRPSPFRENQICMPWRNARLAVRPGITGLWQICRHDRGEGDFSQWICYDVAYVRHMSFWLDMKILFYTFVSCVVGWKYISMKTVLPNADHHCD